MQRETIFNNSVKRYDDDSNMPLIGHAMFTITLNKNRVVRYPISHMHWIPECHEMTLGDRKISGFFQPNILFCNQMPLMTGTARVRK